jgi:hypothetical protein
VISSTICRPFREVWAVDFEFIPTQDECPEVVCMVALELRSGQILHCWRDELTSMASPPFPISSDALYIAYAVNAELSCHLALGWRFPERVFDCYVEFRRLTNGRPRPMGTGLLAALSAYGIDSMGTEEKSVMRDLIIGGGPWTTNQRREILDYCESDVRALEKLFPHILADVIRDPGDLGRALHRGRSMRAIAHMEATGAPIDTATHSRIRDGWDKIQHRLISDIDADYGVYDGLSFVEKKFAAYLIRADIPWPRLASGRLDLKGDTFRQMAKSYPLISPLHELRHTLGELRLHDLSVSRGGRNRVSLMPFRASTGRNQPSTSKFIFGPATWLRGLIKPPPGRAIAYVDWSAQEVAIAAALSGDKRYMNAYASGDVYLTFAKAADLAPKSATKQTHQNVRELCKQVVLGANYGMGPATLAARIGGPEIRARQLQEAHRRTYPQLYDWLESGIDHGMVHGYVDTVFGWRIHANEKTNPRSLRNFPCQGNGAEMMRLACALATEEGLMICCPVHDALLLESDIGMIDADVQRLREIMEYSSRVILDGFTVRTESEICCFPDRYMDPRGLVMWDKIQKLLHEVDLSSRGKHESGPTGGRICCATSRSSRVDSP